MRRPIRDDRPDRQRQGDKGDKRHRPVLIEHHGDKKDDGHRVLADPGQHIARRAAQQPDVIHEARDQRAARMGVEIRQIAADQAGEHRGLHIGDDALADPVHQDGLAVIGQRFDDRQRQRGAGDQQQQRGILRDEDAVEHRLHQPGARRRAAARQGHAQQRQRNAAPMPPHEVAHQAADQRGRASLQMVWIVAHQPPPPVLEARRRVGKAAASAQRRGGMSEQSRDTAQRAGTRASSNFDWRRRCRRYARCVLGMRTRPRASEQFPLSETVCSSRSFSSVAMSLTSR